MTTLTASQARPGDVLLDAGGACWLRGGDATSWSTFTGPVVFYGPWLDSYGPQGELTLIARDGKPATGGGA